MNARSSIRLLISLALLLIAIGSGQAQGPNAQAILGAAITYQGQLKSGGVPVQGSCDLQFSLWDGATGGSQIGSTQTRGSVAVNKGLFTVLVDFGVGAFTGDARWLGIKVRCPAGSGTYTTLTPRQPLTAAPYALALPGLWTQPNSFSPNIIGGFAGNSVTSGAVGASIGGGGADSSRHNRATDDYTTVSGGLNNLAGNANTNVQDAPYAVIGGGGGNTSSEGYATIGGGEGNTASGHHATVSGGYVGQARGVFATLGGGSYNTASEAYATVCGGDGNTASGSSATVGGGTHNTASDSYATVGGGISNTASANSATVGGGSYNEARSLYVTVGGGYHNIASGSSAAIAGGAHNTSSGGYAAIGGGEGNAASKSHALVAGGKENIASGDMSTGGGGEGNTASGQLATVGGGYHNTAAAYAAIVGGGQFNSASGSSSAIGGGYANTAGGSYATVPGGTGNAAMGNYSLAAGYRAKANHLGAFVWGDSTDADVTSSGVNQFTIRASGGIRMYTNTALTSGVQVPAGGGAWSSVSDRNLKENFASVDGRDVLRRLANIPITAWNYKSQDDSVRHMGPVAQDFSAAFGLGEDDVSISTVDADGVALAGLQGAYQLLQEKDAQIISLEARVAALEAIVAQLAKK